MNEIVCQSCRKQKQDLKRISSKLIDGWQLNMCTTCIASKFEPRFIVVLAANQYNLESAKVFIKKKLYCGEPILAEDII